VAALRIAPRHPRLPDIAVLDAAANRLRRELGAEHVVLYGSTARGEARADSDIDLLVVAPLEGTRWAREDQVKDHMRDIPRGVSIQPIVLTPDEVYRRLRNDDRFIRLIIDTGTELGVRKRSARQRWGRVRPMEGARASDEWRETARKDWRGVEDLLPTDNLYGTGMFLQQAAEKYLKGWLLDRGWPLQKTHKLEGLIADAAAIDPSLGRYAPLCERVTKYYLAQRYPGAGASEDELERVPDDVEVARELIRRLFPDEQL
jgi:predicted nucleotidyltransferase/HEPN domain-containing protein